MTAESVEHRHPWPVPPVDGYTVDDLFTLPDLPPHTELIDGSLVFVSPQRRFHFLVIDLLVNGLRGSLGPEFSVEREMTVILDKRNGPEPDVSVVRADAVTGLDQTSFHARDVLLAVEVVSPESEARDRMTTPHKYAIAGIPNYWRVEQDGTTGRPLIHVYELDPVTMSYVHMGQQRDRIKVDEPSAIAIELTAVETRS
ncbi:Uma2 family endonuclease [Streptomyces prasinopilosus]|uniref:Endonuclease, Uma2 family (Restriction endonuclease fold) n=1 Tax=Streptomyces prasinopilosus TaxID=67344 RepID=A0A1G6R4R1_9ACTN|nr:Uma2 family endonuclease [Streptomyces prasinopilosus]SDC98987.1 Endonuclease, Uma2 family (restriction endonuclease fold) [Streptomyces prasinopilosus]